MALNTVSTRSNVMLATILAEVPLKALTPKTVFWNLINQDDMDGEQSISKTYNKESDIGPAVAATEGVDFTQSTTLGYDTPVTLTPVEAAAQRSDITTRAIRRRAGLTMDVVAGKIMAGDFTGILGLLEEESTRLAKSLWEKAERDVCAMLDDASNTVGATGVDLSLANILQAIADMDANEPENEDFIWVMAPQQTADLRAALLGASGAATTWFQADAGILNHRADPTRNGLKGSLLGIPWYQTSSSVNPLPNSGADVAGALLCRGVGRPDAPGSQRGAHVFLEGAPMTFLIDVDVSARTIELMAFWEYAVGEITDPHYVSIITDAP